MKNEGEFKGSQFAGSGRIDWRILFDQQDRAKFTATANSLLRKHRRELFGEAQIPAKAYFCMPCNGPVLSQDVVWENDGKPHCSTCSSILLDAESPTDMLNKLLVEWQKRISENRE